jgi:Ca-activated chloride channel family protein
MNPESHDNESLLLDALLQEQNRKDREQAIKAIEDAIAAFATNTTATAIQKRKQRWPWAVGLAASAAIGVGVLQHKGIIGQSEDIIAYHQVEMSHAEKQSVTAHMERENLKDLTGADRGAATAAPPPPPLTVAPTYHSVPPPAPTYSDTHNQYRPDTTTNANLRGIRAIPLEDEEQDNSPKDKGVTTAPMEELKRDKGYDSVPRPAATPAPLASPAPTAEFMGGTRADLTKAPAMRQGDWRPSAITKDTRERGRLTGMEVPTQSPGDRYGALTDPTWKNPRENALSTFSVDVDNAAYSNIRRMIEEGRSIPPDAVRIEECINAFDYGYAPPTNDDAFAVHQALRPCPWNEKHALLRIGIKGREVPAHQRPASNLVFLIDVSGSMQSADKLPLVKESLKVLLDRLDERDSVSYVVYAGSEGVVLPPTTLDAVGRKRAVDALEKLTAGGSTNGGAGIQRAYQIAADQFRKGGVNRVILCSDGDFNVGVTGTSQLVSLVKERAAANIYLSVLSFGTGNLNDEMLEAISRDGNGNYYYIDGIREARKVFLQKLSGTLVTIAKDVKLQLEFNPARIASYRLIGYANRQLRDQDFKDDKVDAGDIGAGHEVTAFYEIVPAGVSTTVSDTSLKYQPATPAPVVAPQPDAVHADEWLTVKLRHKHPEGDISKLQEHALRGDIGAFQEGDSDFRFAASVAMFGMKLRQDAETQHTTWEQIRQLATQGLGDDADRAEFIDLLRRLSGQ